MLSTYFQLFFLPVVSSDIAACVDVFDWIARVSSWDVCRWRKQWALARTHSAHCGDSSASCQIGEMTCEGIYYFFIFRMRGGLLNPLWRLIGIYVSHSILQLTLLSINLHSTHDISSPSSPTVPHFSSVWQLFFASNFVPPLLHTYIQIHTHTHTYKISTLLSAAFSRLSELWWAASVARVPRTSSG